MRSKFGVRRPRRRFGFRLMLPLNNPKRRRAAALQIFLPLYLSFTCTVVPNVAVAQRRTPATITVDTSRPVNRFSPAHALGAAIDGHEKGVNDLQLKPDNIKAMLSAGLRPLTYRLRTELGMDVWHWNPNGSWSDESRRQGYWISNSNLGPPISLSYGYSLPRRGNTIDQAANNGYSRLDDGDQQTFWKSNPYLDTHFTGEDNQLHPQWIVIQFAQRQPINAVRVVWGEPFAKRIRIQYGKFDDPSVIALNPPGSWLDFPHNAFKESEDKTGDAQTTVVRLSQKPIMTGLIRILLTESSASSRVETGDVRDRVGFAVRELYAGMIDDDGVFHDSIRHGLSREQQTIIRVSSTDPWHRASDRDDEIEQAGLDRIYQTGLTNDLPMLV
ncbi:MAG TPA: hypothetical protein VHP99_01070, partial [Pyrinomonadaceae bacterium]|nr:hypothetical protein [Pyrinomonadaceae bacterium]